MIFFIIFIEIIGDVEIADIKSTGLQVGTITLALINVDTVLTNPPFCVILLFVIIFICVCHVVMLLLHLLAFEFNSCAETFGFYNRYKFIQGFHQRCAFKYTSVAADMNFINNVALPFQQGIAAVDLRKR